jgi:hypothetical protein
MIVLMTVKKLKKICEDYYNRGVHYGAAKGYELGYKMARSENTHGGFIIGPKVDE